MVDAQYRLLTEGLGIRHLRLVIGNSMGGMQTWLWGESYPDFMDALVPMASQPTAMAARNWMLRRHDDETIRKDPDYNDGNYTEQPRSMKVAVASSASPPPAARSPTRSWRRRARPTSWSMRGSPRRSRPTPTTSLSVGLLADYDPAPGLERIKAPLLAINAADDERNPPETGVTERPRVTRVKNGRLYLIPASEETRGHGTTGNAKFYTEQVKELLETAPRKAM